MKPHKILLITAVLMTANLQAQQEGNMTESETQIPGPIADGTPSPEIEKPEPIPFTILNSVTKRVHVTESAEMPELPPIQGKIKRTIQLVADPRLPDPPPSLPRLPIDDPAVQARIAEARARYKETQILFLSVQVIDYNKSILEVYPNGQAAERMSVVSSIDFNDFSGFGSFNVAGESEDWNGEEVRQYALIMSISNVITENMQRFATRQGRTYEARELPEFPADGIPSFVVLEGDNEQGLQAIRDMHALYQVEGIRMHESRIAREVAREQRKAYLLANPTKPEDVTIKFWKRTTPSNKTSR